MNDSDDLHQRRDGPAWQLLGQRELPVGTDLEDAIRTWLAELCGPLALPKDFLDRFLRSAHETAARAFREQVGKEADHVHLVIYGPRDPEANLGTWGFFYVEKRVKPAGVAAPVVHSIEFYLYVEGRP